jgi:DNA gyrase/topoisomerase IV subunit B
MTDADVDGAHIASLLLRIFLMYYPQLIEAGMVYKAIPPLYAIPQGKNWKYFTEQIDMTRYAQKLFLSQYNMTDLKNNQINNREITKFLLNNEDYVWYMEKAANTYSIDPKLLEMTLYNYISNNRSINVKKLAKEVKKEFRFMDVTMVGNTPTIIGTIDASNFIPANDKFFADCEDVIKLIDSNNELYYRLNGKVQSLYQILKLYKAMEPKEVKRFKGLGEMNKEMLAESALYPGSDRTLIRYTMEDIKETMLTIREYESDTKKILGEIKRVTRADLLD